MTTGQRIKEARKKAKLTQKELAGMLGIAYQTLAQWENDLRNPKYETLQRIAKELKVSVVSLMDKPAADVYEAGFMDGSEAEEWQNHVIDELWKQDGYTGSDIEVQLISAFSRLNSKGQQKAVESVEIIAGNPDYQKEKDPADGD